MNEMNVHHFQNPEEPHARYEGPPPPHQILDFNNHPSSESLIVQHKPEDSLKISTGTPSHPEKRSAINRDPRTRGNLNDVSINESTAENVKQGAALGNESNGVIKPIPHDMQFFTGNPLIVDIGNTEKSKEKPNEAVNSQKESSSASAKTDSIPGVPRTEKGNSPAKLQSDHIPGILSPKEDSLEIDPNGTFMEPGSSQEPQGSLSVTVGD
jgi:hypothetical protein